MPQSAHNVWSRVRGILSRQSPPHPIVELSPANNSQIATPSNRITTDIFWLKGKQGKSNDTRMLVRYRASQVDGKYSLVRDIDVIPNKNAPQDYKKLHSLVFEGLSEAQARGKLKILETGMIKLGFKKARPAKEGEHYSNQGNEAARPVFLPTPLQSDGLVASI